jgi:thymidylate synthase
MLTGQFSWESSWENPYLSAMRHLLDFGDRRETRNGITLADFVHQMRFDLKKGFPLLTTKKVNFELIVAELLWFIEGGMKPNIDRGEISGRMSLKLLEEIYGKPITQMWVGDAKNFRARNKALFEGDCGRIYGSQWRDWKTLDGKSVDQLANLISKLKTDYTGRYARVTAWNPGEIDQQSLPACHTDFQCFVRKDETGQGWLSLHMNQRSCDMFLGVPFNIASYALLTYMLAQVCSYKVDELIITLNDYHIYEAHVEQVKEQLARTPDVMPKLWINPNITDIDGFKMSDLRIEGYSPHPVIKAPVLTANVKK